MEKELPKDWTTAEEIALCQAWCYVSENSEKGNGMKAKGFWEAVIKCFEKETGSTRGYDSILSKWKNKVRSRIGRFCAIINNIEQNHESGFPTLSAGSSNTDVLDSPCKLVLNIGTSQSRHHDMSEWSCLMLSLEGFPFITVKTKEYHSECSGNYHKDNA
ncbi:hypothetical protein Tco_0371637 [Tanacetum coccineum]